MFQLYIYHNHTDFFISLRFWFPLDLTGTSFGVGCSLTLLKQLLKSRILIRAWDIAFASDFTLLSKPVTYTHTQKPATSYDCIKLQQQ